MPDRVGAEGCRRAADAVAPTEPLLVEPAVKAVGGGNVEAGKRLATIPVKGFTVAMLLQVGFELGGVAPEHLRVDGDLVVTAGANDVAPQLLPEYVKGVAQRHPRSRLVAIGPEGGEEQVPTMPVAWTGRGQVEQQRQPFRLAQQPLHLPACRIAETDRPENRELDHLAKLRRGVISGQPPEARGAVTVRDPRLPASSV